MSGLRCSESHGCRFLVSDFPDHDDFGVVTQKGAKVTGESVADPFIDFTLAEVFIHVFNRFFGGQDLNPRTVDCHESATECRGFPGTRRTGHKKYPAGSSQQPLESFSDSIRKSELGK